MSENDNGREQKTGSRPVETVNNGALSASIWPKDTKNEDGETQYHAKLVRNWKDKNGEYHESSYFSEHDLRNIPNLARNASCIMTGLRHEQTQMREVQAAAKNGEQAVPRKNGKVENRDQFVQQRQESKSESANREPAQSTKRHP